MDEVGLAVIGSTGVIGRVHIDAINRLDHCRLVGINARRQEPLQRQANELQVAHYATLEEVLTAPGVDAIVIATPHPSHLEIVLKAAEAGKHVLVEKPMGVTPAEADSMIDAARSAGVKLGVLFNNRFRPEALKAKELIEQGAIGEVCRTNMSSVMLRTQDYYDRLDWRGTWHMEAWFTEFQNSEGGLSHVINRSASLCRSSGHALSSIAFASSFSVLSWRRLDSLSFWTSSLAAGGKGRSGLS